MNYSKIIDISILNKNGMIMYPHTPDLHINTVRSASGTSTHSEISMGTHTGTHVDAPYHGVHDGLTLDKIPLETFIGACKVFDFSNSKDNISLEVIKNKSVNKGDRIILKTDNSRRGFEQWYDDYVYLSGDAADYLAEKQIALVGIDALSIKQKGSKDLRPHTSILSKNIPIIEGVNLQGVAEGEYFLIALAPRFDLDGFPMRVVLVQ